MVGPRTMGGALGARGSRGQSRYSLDRELTLAQAKQVVQGHARLIRAAPDFPMAEPSVGDGTADPHTQELDQAARGVFSRGLAPSSSFDDAVKTAPSNAIPWLASTLDTSFRPSPSSADIRGSRVRPVRYPAGSQAIPGRECNGFMGGFPRIQLLEIEGRQREETRQLCLERLRKNTVRQSAINGDLTGAGSLLPSLADHLWGPLAEIRRAAILDIESRALQEEWENRLLGIPNGSATAPSDRLRTSKSGKPSLDPRRTGFEGIDTPYAEAFLETPLASLPLDFSEVADDRADESAPMYQDCADVDAKPSTPLGCSLGCPPGCPHGCLIAPEPPSSASPSPALSSPLERMGLEALSLYLDKEVATSPESFTAEGSSRSRELLRALHSRRAQGAFSTADGILGHILAPPRQNSPPDGQGSESDEGEEGEQSGGTEGAEGAEGLDGLEEDQNGEAMVDGNRDETQGRQERQERQKREDTRECERHVEYRQLADPGPFEEPGGRRGGAPTEMTKADAPLHTDTDTREQSARERPNLPAFPDPPASPNPPVVPNPPASPNPPDLPAPAITAPAITAAFARRFLISCMQGKISGRIIRPLSPEDCEKIIRFVFPELFRALLSATHRHFSSLLFAPERDYAHREDIIGNRVIGVERDRRKYQALCRDAEQECRQLALEHAQKVEATQAALLQEQRVCESASREQEELQARIQGYTTLLQRLRNTSNSAMAGMSDAKKKLESLQTQCSRIQQYISSSLTPSLEKAHEDLKVLQSQEETLRTQKLELDAQEAALAKEREGVGKKRQELSQTLAAYAAEVSHQREKQLQDLASALRQYEDAAQLAAAAFSSLEAQLKELACVRAHAGALSAEKAALQRELEELTETAPQSRAGR